jgi:hypothetical protein
MDVGKLKSIAVMALLLVTSSCRRDAETAPVFYASGALVREVVCRPTPVTTIVGGQFLASATVNADSAVTDHAVTWSSNSPNATVSVEGIVTGVSAGPALVIASAHADPNVKGACAVTVVVPGAID